MAKEKKIIANEFTDGVDTDTTEEDLSPKVARFLLNCRIYGVGTIGKVINVPGNLQIPNLLPAGNNLCLGWGNKEDSNAFYWANWNSNGNHGIYKYDDLTQTIVPVIQNLVQTNGIDIFRFSSTSRINHFDIINDSGNDLGYWVDGLNKARKTNLTRALNGGYGAEIFEEFITAYKPTAPYPVVPVYGTDINTNTNYLYGQLYKFCQRYIYADGEVSNASDFSIVPLPPNQNYNGSDAISYNNNYISVPVFTGSGDVVQIEILVQIMVTANNQAVLLPWQSAIVLNKQQLQIADNTTYAWSFYNNLPLTAVDNIKINRPYSFLPDIPFTQSFLQKAMSYGNFPEGKPTYIPNASVAVTSQNLFLPSGTTPQLNSPAFIVTLISSTFKRGSFFSNGGWYITVTSFQVGFDVKKGNVFVMVGVNGALSLSSALQNGSPLAAFTTSTQDNYFWKVTAGYGDTAETIAAQLKAFLRSTGRGVPDGNNGISNESIDGSGNVSWEYSYLGRWDANKTVFGGSVTPVNYSTLTDDGSSVNVIKSGGPRQYAIVMEDSDGRKFGAYTCPALLCNTPFRNQWGTATLQQPIHTISIFTVPPPWAYKWYLVRTSDITGEIQMLIQQVTQISVINEGVFLDLIVGSLYTYQLIHPDTVIQYQFQRGDRVRFIKNEITGNLFSYYDTEVLSYVQTEQQIITSQIVCTNSAIVTPADGVKLQYVGKNIIINGAERTIVELNNANPALATAYILNEPINPNLANPLTSNINQSTTYPSYTIIDRRGTIRINQPPPYISFVWGSLVAGSGYTPGYYPNTPLTGGSGTGAQANITVGAGGTVTIVVISNVGNGNYQVGDNLSASLPAGSGFQITVGTLNFSLVEVYHPQANAANEESNAQYQNFQECGLKFPILNPGTPQAAFVGNINNSSGTPNQDPTNPVNVPAIVQVTQGEAYYRQRFLPTNVPYNPDNPSDVQGIVDSVEDPNFSDFYGSNLYSLGRIYPQDQGAGLVIFDQRERYSNNYIQDTKINGLNDFDDTDRKDYNDQYGAIMLSRYRRGILLMYKQLHTTWTQVLRRKIVSDGGQSVLATSDNLLNDLEYSELEVGIGNNPESWFESDGHYYFGSTNGGVFVRQAQDGEIPISKQYNYDLAARAFLTQVAKYGLAMPGGFDKTNNDSIWSYPPFIEYLYNGGFNPSQWQTQIAAWPAGTTWTITQQPANSVATVAGQQINITGTNTLGNDYFLYQGNLPGGGTTPVQKFCFTVVVAPANPTGWTQDVTTTYCLHDASGNNNGLQGWKVIDEIYLNGGASAGFKMPNIAMISPQAICPTANTITFNAYTNVTPTGGVNLDVWYNAPADTLYQNQNGTWTLLTNRFTNAFYIQPIQNLGSCPLPAPTAYYNVTSEYNVNISGLSNGSCSGTPASLASINLFNGQQANAVYTAIGAGTVNVHYLGAPALPGHTYLQLSVGGVVEDTQPVPGGSIGTVALTFSTSPNSPTQINIYVITM